MQNNNYIQFTDGEKSKGFKYGSGLSVFTEKFNYGMLKNGGFYDNGLPFADKDENNKISFDLQIEAQNMSGAYEYIGFESSYEGGTAVGVISLRHKVMPVNVNVVTRCTGYGFFTRYLEIINTSENRTMGIASVSPLCGKLWRLSDSVNDNMENRKVETYSVGHFIDFEWGGEGNFGWQDIPINTTVSYRSYTGKSGHSNPFFILRNNIYGGYFMAELAWTNNWKMSFFNEYPQAGGFPAKASLDFEIKPDTVAPCRTIAPGETVKSPEVHFGMSHVSLDDIVQNNHRNLRRNIFNRFTDHNQPVIYNHWGYMEHEMDEDKLMKIIDVASGIGCELLIIDAGWFGNKGTDWGPTVGDWVAGDRLPNDLFPVFSYARQKGLKYGIWMEIESVGAHSQLAKDHPDWCEVRMSGSPISRKLNMAKPEVRAHIQSEIERMIKRYDLDLVRIDYNINPGDGGFEMRDSYLENVAWRYNEALYSVFDELRAKYPNVQFENCSGGGGRTDVGMVSRFTTTWVSDWMRMPRTVRILNGMSMVLPPEYVNRMFGVAMEGSYNTNSETVLQLIILAHPTISGISTSMDDVNPELFELTKKYIGIYKDFIRPFASESVVYHHDPVIAGADGEGWCALEYVSEDRTKAVAGIFRLLKTEGMYLFKFKGLDPALSYKVTVLPGGMTFGASGRDLMANGHEAVCETALTSQMLLVEEIKHG